jgi:hypothetical protein
VSEYNVSAIFLVLTRCACIAHHRAVLAVLREVDVEVGEARSNKRKARDLIGRVACHLAQASILLPTGVGGQMALHDACCTLGLRLREQLVRDGPANYGPRKWGRQLVHMLKSAFD